MVTLMTIQGADFQPMKIDETSAKAIGRRLKALRLGYGLTQQAMGHLLGYKSPRGQAWQHFEAGTKRMTLDGFERLQRRFAVSYRWVYHGEVTDLSPILLDHILKGQKILVQRGEST